jgi:hypothetical protein
VPFKYSLSFLFHKVVLVSCFIVKDYLHLFGLDSLQDIMYSFIIINT